MNMLGLLIEAWEALDTQMPSQRALDKRPALLTRGPQLNFSAACAKPSSFHVFLLVSDKWLPQRKQII